MTGKSRIGFNTVRRTKSAGLAAAASICMLLGSQVAMGQLLDKALVPTTKKLSKLSPSDRQEAQKLFSGLPLLFEKNQGQGPADTDFLSRSADEALFLKASEAVMVHSSRADHTRSYVTMQWLGANAKASAEGKDEIGAKSNYFVGSDSTHWTTKIANYTGVKYSSLYPGVDLVYYGNQHHLEYDLNLAAGADPAAIRFRVEGAAQSRIDKQTGDLVMQDSGNNEVRFHKPLVYQDEGDTRQPVSANFALDAHNDISFSLGAYDHTRPLVIDPYVVYSTVFGGSDINAHAPYMDLNGYNSLLGMVVDSAGHVYLMGVTSADNMPTTSGVYQPACDLAASGTEAGQCFNFFVAKFDPTKSGAASLLYSTFLGVTVDQFDDNDTAGLETSTALAVDPSGNTYLVGNTGLGSGSYAYPTTTNAYSPTCGMGGSTSCYGGVFSKLDSTGSNLLYSTFLSVAEVGGSYGAVYPYLIGVDSSQIAYIAGVASPGLVTTDGSVCTPCAGYSGSTSNITPGFIMALDTTKNNAASLVYSEYLPLFAQFGGGPGPFAMAVDPSGNAYITGDYPSGLTGLVTQPVVINGFQQTDPGATPAISYNPETAVEDPFLLKLNSAGAPTYATYVGTTVGPTDATSTPYQYSWAQTLYAVAADASGVAYIGGLIGNPAPIVGGYYNGGVLGGYVAKVDTTQTGVNSLLYSTYVNSEETANYFGTVRSIASNGAGLLAFGATSVNPPAADIQVNPLTQPYFNPEYGGISLAGVLDTTKTGATSIQFLSYLDGVYQPDFVAFDATSNLYVGGSAALPSDSGTAYYDGPFLALPSSFAVTEGQPQQAGGTTAYYYEPFFYKISFAPSTITLAPTSLAFGNQIQNIASTSQPVVVTNTSTTTAITFTNITLPAPYTETDNCQPSLPASSFCTINVVYTPTTLTASNSTMTLWDSDVSTTQTVSLTGTGIAGTPGATLTSAIAFGTVQTGTTTSTMPITLENSGTTPLTGITVTLGGTNPTNFTMSNGCASTLAIGASCTIHVSFSPNASNIFTATVSVTDNATPSPQVSNLSGTGATFTATLSPTFINFGTIGIGSTSTPVPVTLTNTGTGVISITSIGFLYNTTNVFALGSSSSPCGATLAVGASCIINVTADPKVSGQTSAYLNVIDNSTTSPHQTSIYVAGPYPLALTSIGTPGYAVYAQNLSASTSTITTSAYGGIPPYTFTNTLPVGSGSWTETVSSESYLSIDGAPAVVNPFGIPFSITVTDSVGSTATLSSTLYTYWLNTTTALSATPTVLPGGTNLNFSITEAVPATNIPPAVPTGSVSYQIDGAGAITSLPLTSDSTGAQTLSFDILYHQIVFTYSGDSNYVSPGATYNVNGNRAQTITFAGGINAPSGSTIALTAHASSGLSVTYSVISGPGVIDGSGTNLIFTGTGPITVQASQAGDPSFAAAPNVTATFTGY